MIKFGQHTKLLFILITVIFLGFISCGTDEQSSDEQWKYVGEIRDEKGKYVSVYIDLKSMEINDNIRTFWISYYADKDGATDEEKYIRQIGQWEVDCQDRTLYVLKEDYYGPDGKLLGKSEKRFKEEYEENSIGAKLSSAACRYAGRN